MPFVVVKDIGENIWKSNPGLELISEFRKFKKAEGEDRSSNIIKAIYFIWDPKSNLKDSALPEDKLVQDISDNLLGDADFNWDDYEEIIEFYLKYNISEGESLLLRYEKEIKDLDAMLREWTWNKKDIRDRSLAVDRYKQLFEDYIEIRDRVRAENKDKMEMHGNYQKSFLEQF